MKRVFVNEDWCLGCHLCEYNCAYANSGIKDMVKALQDVKINPNIRIEEKGDIHFAVSCRHCEDPLCVKSCITGSLSVKDGVICVDKDKCIGCYTCVLSCPYGCINPSDKGVISKCELCTNNGEVPQCVEGCPNGAIVFEER